MFHDTATFSSCNSVTGPFPGSRSPLVGDDVSALIDEHRDELPFSDQLPTLDPPMHTAHRALLMRLITPKRLQRERGVHVAARRPPARRVRRQRRVRVRQRVREPVRAARDRRPARCARGRPRHVPRRARARNGPDARIGSTERSDGAQSARVPLRAASPSTSRTAAAPARRRHDRARDRDVPRRLAARGHRRRAGRRQPVRGRPGDDGAPAGERAADARRTARAPAAAARRPRPHSELRRGDAAVREPDQGRLPAVTRRDDGRRRRHPGGHDRDGAQRRREPRPAPLRPRRRVPASTARTRASTSRSGTACTRAPARRSRGPRRASASSASSTACATSRSRKREHGPAGARRYDYVPTYILRGLTRACTWSSRPAG